MPVGAATLEALGLLLEVLGEVSAEAVALLREPLAQKLACGHGLLRAQARSLSFCAFCKHGCWEFIIRALTIVRASVPRYAEGVQWAVLTKHLDMLDMSSN